MQSLLIAPSGGHIATEPAPGASTPDRGQPVTATPPPPGRPVEQHQIMEGLLAQGPIPPADNRPKEQAVASISGRNASTALQGVVDDALSRIARAGSGSRVGQEESRIVRVALYRADQLGVALV